MKRKNDYVWKNDDQRGPIPGRLLNVLCTFNLRPVSTGKIKEI